MSEQQTEKYLRTRKRRLFLPLIIVAITAIFFRLMGGGTVVVTESNKTSGLNTQLPGARSSKDSSKDKMSFYASADVDSSKRSEALRDDPYRKDTVQIITDKKPATFVYAHSNTETEAITNKIAAIQRRIATTNSTEPVYTENKTVQALPVQKAIASSPDPEMEAINATLEKILEIQHPDRVKEKSISKKTSVFAVGTAPSNADDSFFGRHDSTKIRSGFQGEINRQRNTEENCIRAEIDGSQIVQSGSMLKLRLLSDVYVAGTRIPSGTNVFGLCALDNERLTVHIPSIGYGNNILPVSLSVYDLGGLPGIYAPGSIARDVVKETADQSLQSIGILNIDPSLKSQLTAAGIGAAKNILSKKVKQVNVTAKAGYQVLLRDDNEQNNH